MVSSSGKRCAASCKSSGNAPPSIGVTILLLIATGIVAVVAVSILEVRLQSDGENLTIVNLVWRRSEVEIANVSSVKPGEGGLVIELVDATIRRSSAPQGVPGKVMNRRPLQRD